ncbi:MAG: Holliday junction DNA helicase RuvA, holliday junction DNA helicase RuvA [Candidatus Dadabacteria bacterium CSP1-2]|jgi:Holliday junction DNA helicase RuvA|nr:MAG: Holliday junction DNA helicase RuvA, holliday junction DNA helicase RuvA [Candidatus Dadabacteria bacterium CSP1-2]OGE23184.1 MAG: Holliday junction DNA helicase RuvA [Candidatus Dadabacteria bacterium RBG_19FT_COMBO_40_33]
MISLLRGKIAEKSLGKIVIDIHGVGYGVTVPLSTYYRLPERGSETELKIYTHMKGDGIELFGFLTEDERRIFTSLLGVAGVGPRVATNILSSISPGELVSAISSGDLVKKKIPGIGPKLASRLITELKDKVSMIQPAGDDREKMEILEDIISALINLGYKRSEIDERISQLQEVTLKEKDIEKALKESLKIMRRV